MVNHNKRFDESLDPKTKKEEIINRFRSTLDLDGYSEDDWTFKIGNTKEFTHVIFNNYPSRMIPQLVRKLIRQYYPQYKKSTLRKPLLDPFAGSGTTCVEALLQNIDSIGFDLNPFAHLLQKTKTSIINPDTLKCFYSEIMRFFTIVKTSTFREYLPNGNNLEYWFDPRVLSQLTVLRHSIEEVTKLLPDFPSVVKEFFMICLAKTARGCSFQRSSVHKNYRISESKIPEFVNQVDVASYFKDIFDRYLSGLSDLFDYYHAQGYTAHSILYQGNVMELANVKSNSVDLIITSPPYGDSHTAVAYSQFSRIPLQWRNSEHGDIQQIENPLLGEMKQDTLLHHSPTLFKNIKNLLTAEIQQQSHELLQYLKEIEKFFLARKRKFSPMKLILDHIQNQDRVDIKFFDL